VLDGFVNRGEVNVKDSDKLLGMNRRIKRRDFIQGAGALGIGLLAGSSFGEEGAPAPAGSRSTLYPPSRAGLRGSHPGSWEIAHGIVAEPKLVFDPADARDDTEYDLIVVGSGISGLSAAYFYKSQKPDARILILENHDDFGGHAKRNEFSVGNSTMLGYGGSQSLEAPGAYSDVATNLLQELGVGLERFKTAYDQKFFKRNGLSSGMYFDELHFGTNKLVQGQLMDVSAFLPLAPAKVAFSESIREMPISDNARSQFLKLASLDEDKLPHVGLFDEPDYLSRISYRDFLIKHLGVDDPQVHQILQDVPSGYFGLSTDALSTSNAILFGLPGISGTSLGVFEGLLNRVKGWLTEPYIYHFPDGNASIARLLVNRLIPGVSNAGDMSDIATAKFDYSALDQVQSAVRLRLNSTVVKAVHEGKPDIAPAVLVQYVNNGKTHQVRGKHCVLACYNMMIPFICPELGDVQKEALRSLVKVPLIYTNVLLRNWRAWQALGVGVVHSPGCYHNLAMLDFPVSLGDYKFSSGPDDPILVHMNRVPGKPGLSSREQHKAGRQEIQETSFEFIERDIRTHLGGMLGPAGFDPAEDILGITVNRWPHGYAYGQNSLFDPEYEPDELPHVVGRKPWGRIAVANSDAGGRAYLDCAVDEAHRAVSELL
jgi:spermidine dehydrogenase